MTLIALLLGQEVDVGPSHNQHAFHSFKIYTSGQMLVEFSSLRGLQEGDN
jgi:hypothetical protein